MVIFMSSEVLQTAIAFSENRTHTWHTFQSLLHQTPNTAMHVKSLQNMRVEYFYDYAWRVALNAVYRIIVHNVSKFQCCECDNCFVTVQNTTVKRL